MACAGPQNDGKHSEQLRQRVGAHLGERGRLADFLGLGVWPRHPHPSRSHGDLDGGHEGVNVYLTHSSG